MVQFPEREMKTEFNAGSLGVTACVWDENWITITVRGEHLKISADLNRFDFALAHGASFVGPMTENDSTCIHCFVDYMTTGDWAKKFIVIDDRVVCPLNAITKEPTIDNVAILSIVSDMIKKIVEKEQGEQC